MTFLSKGVCVPEEHVATGVAPMTPGPDGRPFDWTRVTAGHVLRPLRQKHRPQDAEVAVQYRGYWFYIAQERRELARRPGHPGDPLRPPGVRGEARRPAADAAGQRMTSPWFHLETESSRVSTRSDAIPPSFLEKKLDGPPQKSSAAASKELGVLVLHSMTPARRETAMSAVRSRWGVLALIGAAIVWLAGTPPVRAQGIIIDRRPHIPIARSYEIREVSDRRPGPRPGGRGPGLADVPQPRVGPDRVGVPLPAARGRGDPELRPAGRRPRAARPAHAQGRGAADLRGDRPDQARPGPARIHGPRALSAPASSRSRPGPTAR